MAKDSALAGSWAVVTGASSGLGREVAKRLATTHRSNLVLVARRNDLLESLAAEVRGYGVEARVIVLDLSTESAACALRAEVDNINDIAAVVLCAGVTHFGEATAMSPADIQRVNATNVQSTATLLSAFAKLFEERRVPGYILVISSMSALIPLPFQAAYSASKSYVRSFVTAVRAEGLSADVSITMAYPLGMDTEMVRGSALQKLVGPNRIGSISVSRCADRAISDLLRRKSVSLVGFWTRIVYLLAIIVPDTWLTRIVTFVYRNAWLEQKAAMAPLDGGQ